MADKPELETLVEKFLNELADMIGHDMLGDKKVQAGWHKPLKHLQKKVGGFVRIHDQIVEKAGKGTRIHLKRGREAGEDSVTLESSEDILKALK